MPEDEFIKGWVFEHPPVGQDWNSMDPDSASGYIDFLIINRFPDVDKTRRERITTEILEDLKEQK